MTYVPILCPDCAHSIIDHMWNFEDHFAENCTEGDCECQRDPYDIARAALDARDAKLGAVRALAAGWQGSVYGSVIDEFQAAQDVLDIIGSV